MWLFLLLVLYNLPDSIILWLICFLTLALFKISATKVAVDDPPLEVKVRNPITSNLDTLPAIHAY